MRLAFMGSPDFATPALLALVEAGHEIVAVYAQPPRPAGRGQALRRAPVHEAADRLGIPVRTPARLRRDGDAHAAFAALDLDAAVVAAYGLILPEAMLAAPRRGCLNIHASLLPRWRGAAPIQAAIRAGDSASGVTIMRMDAGLDTGAMLLSGSVPIGRTTTGASLHDALAPLGAALIVRALAEDPPELAQPEGATYAAKLSRADGQIDWTAPAAVIERQVRAFIAWPGSFSTLDHAPLKIFAASVVPASGHAPGTTIDAQLTIACGTDALRLDRVQVPGRAVMDAAAFLRGRPVPMGARLG